MFHEKERCEEIVWKVMNDTTTYGMNEDPYAVECRITLMCGHCGVDFMWTVKAS